MVSYSLQNVSFAYAESSNHTLHDVSINIEEGAFVLLCGPSGSGKTTLLRQLKKEICPEGRRTGSILYRDVPTHDLEDRISVEEIGMVFQDPDHAIVMNTVWQELTFGMENLGYKPDVIQRRIGELVSFFGMDSWLDLNIHELSGGQKQIVSLASVMSLRPRVLLLDEPTAQLDPIAAKEFIQWLTRINEELSITVIISEHRMEELFAISTQVIMLDHGQVIYNGESRQVIREIIKKEDPIFQSYLPSISQLYMLLGKEMELSDRIPISVKEGRKWLYDKYKSLPLNHLDNHLMMNEERNEELKKQEKVLLECKHLFYTYDKNHPLVVKGLSLRVHDGEFFTLFGSNGSGKSTLLQLIAGGMKPQRGDILFEGKSFSRKQSSERNRYVGYVAQNPLLYFTHDTVRGQLQSRLHDLGEEAYRERLDDLIDRFELQSILDHHPFDISGGQQQKVVLAMVLLTGPKLLLLDEPTKGMDPLAKIELAAYLKQLQNQGTTILMVSHDIEFSASYATRCGLLFDGQMTAVQDTGPFLQDNFFYTTIVHRTARDIMDSAVTVQDVLSRCIT
ncbi:ATP-binding cassette domain-containing protein [Paenibacillus sp. Marseille-Q4541]|uniref:ABC transporter ATP-binding protein n=1 Tax=Paenibacillus sp. Marseille-Q4541 TaxID=2831522 RepID=UPI001BA8E4DD|nr:ATP-binding cassette domain-containing protein [Paenibacillus sp. Marseille-Q4541]